MESICYLLHYITLRCLLSSMCADRENMPLVSVDCIGESEGSNRAREREESAVGLERNN